MSELEIAINSAVQDLIHARGYQDLDGFGIRLARDLGERLQALESLQVATSLALAQEKTSFFTLNRIQRADFMEDLLASIHRVKLPSRDLKNVLLAFKSVAERQFVYPLLRDQSEENFRTILQAFLARDHITFREVPTGKGRTDVVVQSTNGAGEDVIEAKVWHGPTYHEDGLLELSNYLAIEGLVRGFYMVLDFGDGNPLLESKGSEVWTQVVNHKAIEVIFVRIPLVAPSRLGREARKASRGVSV